MKFKLNNGLEYYIKLREIASTLEAAYNYWELQYKRAKVQPEGLIMNAGNEELKFLYQNSENFFKAMNSVLKNTMLLDNQVIEYLQGKRKIEKILFSDGKGVHSTDLEYVIKLVKYMGLDTVDRKAIRESFEE
ncbi:hypothetical protein KY314_03310 [Candidatus Woesearchaeota archaeon]|nr:hypothetical protein [Candidatus Woesearchaeota archaeon]